MELSQGFLLKIITFLTFKANSNDDTAFLIKKAIELKVFRDVTDEDVSWLHKVLEIVVDMVFKGCDYISISQELKTHFGEKYTTTIRPFLKQHKENVSMTKDDNDIVLKYIQDKLTQNAIQEMLKVFQEKKDAKHIEYDKIRTKLFEYFDRVSSITSEHKVIMAEDLDAILETVRLINSDGKENARKLNLFTTGLDKLDSYLQLKGIEEGRLMFWASPPGVGKSITMLRTAMRNYMKNKRVIYITLENSKEETVFRLLSMTTGTPTDELANNIDSVVEKYKTEFVEKYKTEHNFFEIKEMQHGTSLDEILFYIRSRSIKPEVVIIDYFDIIGCPSQFLNLKDYLQLGKMAFMLKSFASENHMFVMTASQLNRESIDDEYADIDKIAGSMKKMEIADLAVFLRQSPEMYANNIMDYYIAKSRISKKKIVVQCTFDTETLQIIENSSFSAKAKPRKNQGSSNGFSSYE